MYIMQQCVMSNYRSLVLLVYLSILFRLRHAQLGFVCQGEVEYKAELITQFQKDGLYFYSDSNAADMVECARKCYRKEFCRAAVFDTRRRSCEHSYFKGSCTSATERVSRFDKEGIIQLTCIRCERGHRVENEPRGRQVSFRQTASIITSSRPVSSARRRVANSPSRLISVSGTGSRSGSTRRPPTLSDFERWNRRCYSAIEQMVLLGGGFAVERGLTLPECQCLCARSFLSRRYNVQCRSIMYYPSRHECVLSHQNKNNVSHPLVQIAENDPVTYYDFSCHRREREITQYIDNVCDYINQPSTTATTAQPISQQSDLCYEEVEEYIMRGSAVAIERKIPIKQCKCLCATSHQASVQHGFRCMSIMYYYHDQFCILNNDNRLQRPDKFFKDVTRYNVTYYEFSCLDSQRRISEYMHNHCQNVTVLKPDVDFSRKS